MPVKRCQQDNKPGYKWGDTGKCYTYTPGDKGSRKRAYNKAAKQGRAVWKRRQGSGRTLGVAEPPVPEVSTVDEISEGLRSK